MRARGIYEFKRHYQNPDHLRQDQRYLEKYDPGAVRGKGARVLRNDWLISDWEYYLDCKIPQMDYQWPFYYDVLKGRGNRLCSLVETIEFKSRFNC